MKTVLLGASFVGGALAQGGAWAQCGGNGFSGPSTCVSGYSCIYVNDWYSQCQPGTAPTTAKTTTKATPTTTKSTPTSVKTTVITTSTPTTMKTATTTQATTTSKTNSCKPAPTSSSGSCKLKWLGVNESGAEFGSGTFPGTYGKDFTFASTTSIDTLMSQGFNIFRLPFSMERMAPGTLTADLATDYLTNYTSVVNHITQKGGYAVIDPHNFGRYNGAIISDTTGFQSFWNKLASAFKSNANAIFDTNNEYHDMDQTLVFNLNQAAINGIRAAGATSQYIFAEGNNYSAASQFGTNSDNLKGLTDPSNKIVYEMHQYLDSDNSGTSDVCVSSTIGVDRVSPATTWLRANGKVGIIGENAGGANPTCLSAVTGLLDHLQANSDVWLGYLWWGGGPWWGDYIYGFEPPTSTGYNYYDSALLKYKP